MGNVIALKDRRKSTRVLVQIPAVASVGNLTMEGLILDMSDLGVFFTPSTMYVDGRFLTDQDEMVDELAMGDVIDVQPVGSLLCGAHRGTVKWLGASHDVLGVGVGFQQDAVRVSA